MLTRPSPLTRRDWLQSAAVGSALTLAAGRRAAGADPNERIAFYFVSDTHYLANKESPGELDPRSATITTRFIRTLNELPGETLPDAAGAGVVQAPRGVIHGGDLIDTGDKTGALHERMQRTEWDAFCADFGVTGTDAKLKYPVREVHGNHDSPSGAGLAIDGLKERTKRRPGLTGVSANGLHYSWDWGPVHFVNLGIVVGAVPAVTQKRRYNPLDSLEFLAADLKQSVGDSGRPVVLTHHVDVVRYTGKCDPADPANLGKEWNPCDVRAYYDAIHSYRIAAILFGHTHARNVVRWNGETTAAEQPGLPLFNVDNSSHFGGEQQAFFYFEASARELLVRECQTKDGWQTHFWTPQTWRVA